jgi:hypothetical protein
MVLLVVVLILAIILVLGAAALTLATGAKRVAIMQDHRTQAYYIADAGVERALAMLSADPTLTGKVIDNQTYPDNSEGEIVQVSVIEDADNQPAFGRRVQIISEGHFREEGAPGHAQERLAVNVRVVSVADLLGGISILPPDPIDDLETKGSVDIDSESEDEQGLLLLNGSLTLGESAEIEADVYVSGTVTDENGIEGICVQYYPFIPPFPIFDEQWFRKQAEQSETFFSKDPFVIGEPPGSSGGQVNLDISKLKSGKIYFIDGNVIISGEYSVPAIIVATGDIKGNKGLKRKKDDDKRKDDDDSLITLIAFGSKNNTAGDVSIGSGGEYDGEYDVEALIIAHGTLRMWGNAKLLGGIIAQNLGGQNQEGKLTGTVEIECAPSLVKQSLPPAIIPPPLLTIESWKET